MEKDQSKPISTKVTLVKKNLLSNRLRTDKSKTQKHSNESSQPEKATYIAMDILQSDIEGTSNKIIGSTRQSELGESNLKGVPQQVENTRSFNMKNRSFLSKNKVQPNEATKTNGHFDSISSKSTNIGGSEKYSHVPSHFSSTFVDKAQDGMQDRWNRSKNPSKRYMIESPVGHSDTNKKNNLKRLGHEKSTRKRKQLSKSHRRNSASEYNKKAQKRKRRCCGLYCTCCSPLCLLLSILGALVLAAAAAAITMGVIKSQRGQTTTTSTTQTTSTSTSTTTTTTTTVTTTTTTTSTTTTTTTSSTSTTTTTSTSTTTTTATSTTTTTATSTTTTSTTTTSATTTTTTSTTSATTTTTPTLVLLTRAGDPIKGVYNTSAGGDTGGFDGKYSGSAEQPPAAIDNNVNTKYLNYGINGTGSVMKVQPGKDTGFYVTPTINAATIACGIKFATANDYPARDPLTITLEGTNSTALNSSSVWTLLYSGPTGINPTTAPARSTFATMQVFSNNIPFRSYRLLITSQRGNEDSVQYSEAQIFGYF